MGRSHISELYSNLCMAVGVIMAITCLSSCVSNHQVLKYECPINGGDNIIPGIEPEESARKIMIMVRGKGIEPEDGTPMQKKFMAERAAILDGYRNLAERLAGIIIDTHTSAGNSTLSQDEVMIETRAFMRGAQVGPVTYKNGFAIVDLKLYLAPRQNMFFSGKFRY
jgi:hypothetical protein